MKTFESCNRVWLTMPEDGKPPVRGYMLVRLLLPEEKEGKWAYANIATPSAEVIWGDPYTVGWYPVHADGTDDHETAKMFQVTPRSPRKREIRRRFKLSTKRSIINHHS